MTPGQSKVSCPGVKSVVPPVQFVVQMSSTKLLLKGIISWTALTLALQWLSPKKKAYSIMQIFVIAHLSKRSTSDNQALSTHRQTHTVLQRKQLFLKSWFSKALNQRRYWQFIPLLVHFPPSFPCLFFIDRNHLFPAHVQIAEQVFVFFFPQLWEE